ncbi:MAG: substrate-binding domain-containing protein [Acidimicrobiales bacterium]
MPSPSGLAVNALAQRRTGAQLTQAELAARAGVSRQAIGGIEAGRHAATVEVSLRLARALGCRVEDLFSLSPDPTGNPSWSPEFGPGPARVVVAWVAERMVARPVVGLGDRHMATVAATGIVTTIPGKVGSAVVRRFGGAVGTEAAFLVGCDPALGLLASHLDRQPGPTTGLWWPAGNSSALNQLRTGLAHAACVHGPDPAHHPGLVAIGLAAWEMGWALPPGQARSFDGIPALIQQGGPLINREVGSGARALLDRLLAASGIEPGQVNGYGRELAGHGAVAAAISYGVAHAGLVPAPVAQFWGLDFVPVEEQSCALITTPELAQGRPFRQIADTLCSGAFRADLAACGPFDTSQTGERL